MGRTLVRRFLWLALPLFALIAGPAPADEKFHAFASVGTGALKGVYYPVGGAICAIVNDHIRLTGVRCSPETTPGSVYNLEALRSGELELAIVQSDVAFDAYSGKGGFSDSPFKNLRSVLVLHPELVTIVGGAAIHKVSDLLGKRINVGPEGSGSRRTWETLQQALGWTDAQGPKIVDMPAEAVGSSICSGAIDAGLLVVGHPSATARDLMSRCAVNLLAVDGPVVDLLVAGAPYLKKGEIPGALYGLSTNTPSFGVSAVLMTRADTDDRIVAAFARALVTEVEALKGKNPTLANLTIQDMTSGNLPAPIHPAALQVYRELGLLK